MRALAERPLDGVVAHALPEAHVADRRYLVWTERRVLRLEFQHPLALEAVRLSIDHALRYARLSGRLSGGLPEEPGTRDSGWWSEHLVQALLGGPDKQLQLAPVLGRFYALASESRHGAAMIRRSGQFENPRLGWFLRASVMTDMC